MPHITEDLDYFIINVNDFPFYRTENWRPDKGIIRIYGQDYEGKERINQVKYPKLNYTREYIEENVLHKYDTCPLCQIGREIESDSEEQKIKSNWFSKNPAATILIVVFTIVLTAWVAKYIYDFRQQQQNI